MRERAARGIATDEPARPQRSGSVQVNWRIRGQDGSNQLAMEENAMLKTIALIGLGTAIAFTPLPTIAQTDQSAAPAASTATAPTGSHKSQMRHRSNMSKERARASAHHMRHMRHQPAPTTPKTP